MNAQDKENLLGFYKAILCLKDIEECDAFFEDMCTSKEIISIAQRQTVAKMLRQKRVYSEIVSKTGASTATVSRVKRMMDGGTGTVSKLLERTGD